MHDFIRKLWFSKSTIAILLLVAVFAWIYNIDKTKKPMIKVLPTGKTIEEIISNRVVDSKPVEWDNNFKSSIEESK